MKNVMTRAWEIAKEGAAKFGGKAVEYLAEALRMAWAEMKNVATKIEITLREGSRNNKTWVAVIKGLSGKWGFDREFIDCRQHPQYREKLAVLEEGRYYEVCNGGDRDFVKVENGEMVYIEKEDVQAAF